MKPEINAFLKLKNKDAFLEKHEWDQLTPDEQKGFRQWGELKLKRNVDRIEIPSNSSGRKRYCYF
jgi:hypothetical protein